MKVELLQHSDLGVVIRAIRTCYDSMGKSDSAYVEGQFVLGAHDRALLKTVLDSGHHSTIEHMSYTFHIEGISRGCLQELARHRIASLSVKSTRYTLGRIKKEESFGVTSRHSWDWQRIEKYAVLTANEDINIATGQRLNLLRTLATEGVPNDQLKYCLPEAFKTELVWTINARSLRNFLELRLSPRAHWEIKELAEMVKELIPAEHTVLISD